MLMPYEDNLIILFIKGRKLSIPTWVYGKMNYTLKLITALSSQVFSLVFLIVLRCGLPDALCCPATEPN